MPAGEDDERDEQRRERDERHADAVHAQFVADAEVRDPGVRLGELVAVAVRVEADQDGDRQDERGEREEQRQPLGGGALGGRYGGRGDRPDGRERRCRCQQRKGHRYQTALISRVAATMRAAPPNIETA
ncbi:hypothetical protein GCM10023086_18090 [Streptomyces venetus]|uniref:Uncharacterized protein n=1 Tax=Streptomyces venetus TaxID=1701086 RepID=A0ABP8FEK8_9ACTN